MKHLGIDFSKFPYISEQYQKQLSENMLMSNLPAKECKKLLKNKVLWEKINLMNSMHGFDIDNIERKPPEKKNRQSSSLANRFFEYLENIITEDNLQTILKDFEDGCTANKLYDWICTFEAPSIPELEAFSAKIDYDYISLLKSMGDEIIENKIKDKKLIQTFLKNYNSLFDNKTIDAFLDLYSDIK